MAVFEVNQSNGDWSINDLFGFNGALVYPSGLTRDANGNLYGTTTEGGFYNEGYAYEISPAQDGWTTNILYNFGSWAGDGSGVGPLTLDAQGRLYGVAGQGGTSNNGVVFELLPLGGGAWQEVIVHTFSGADGSFPIGSLALDGVGNLYGVTLTGGPEGFGVIFELSPQTNGTWSESILFCFGNQLEGFNAESGPVLDATGNLYGTTQSGGARYCGVNCGVLYRLSPPVRPGLPWTYTVLHDFQPSQIPGPLTVDGAGNIYGFTSAIGTNSLGEAYKFVP
jgi:uncharacterized repeat protein (TIGR03803 family)